MTVQDHHSMVDIMIGLAVGTSSLLWVDKVLPRILPWQIRHAVASLPAAYVGRFFRGGVGEGLRVTAWGGIAVGVAAYLTGSNFSPEGLGTAMGPRSGVNE